MVGITRIGTYFPRRRLDRALIARAWSTRVPAGTRTVAGLDEDALTMATDAVLACLGDADPAAFDALYFASTSSPYLEKQVASMIATAADLRRDVVVADLAGSVRAGVAALRAALDGVRAGSLRTALVAAADARLAEPESELEPLLGDGAAALAVGGEGVVAELVAAASVAEEFTYVWRTDEQRTLRVSETRFGTTYGYVRDVAEAIGAALRKAELPPARIARLALGAPEPRAAAEAVRRAGFDPARQLTRRCSPRRASWARPSRWCSSRARSRRPRRATSWSSPPTARAPTRSSCARPSASPPPAPARSPTASRAASRCPPMSAISARAACSRPSPWASPSRR